MKNLHAFRIRWNHWRAYGETREAAAKRLCELLKERPEQFFELEDAEVFNDRRGILRRLFLG